MTHPLGSGEQPRTVPTARRRTRFVVILGAAVMLSLAMLALLLRTGSGGPLSLTANSPRHAAPTLAVSPTATSSPELAATVTSGAGSLPVNGTLPPPVACAACWHPALNTSWQYQLTGTIDQSYNVAMYDVDLFDTDTSVVVALHQQGRRVVCYLDAGTWENWRPDASSFPPSVLGNSNGWPGERWLDIRQLGILEPILNARISLCRSKGFDGVDFDNVDGYTNETGFALTAQSELAFNVYLANAAHQAGLAVDLKNDLDQIPTLLPYFDWSVDEQCFQYQECDQLTPFISAGKPVMEVEYSLPTTSFCPQADASNFNSLKKHLSLDAYRVACR